jgi:hypothetical protein
MNSHSRNACRPLCRLACALLVASGCASMQNQGQPLVPTRHQTRAGPYAVFTNQPVAQDAPALVQLRSLDRQLEASLGLRVDPAAAPIEVYILEDRPAFEHFLQFYYPGLPHRRAFFLAQGDRRVVYTCMGDRLTEDLRHEATHALLHAHVAELPLWLDEGLAEYFEVPEAEHGRNAEHLARLPQDLADHWKPDLKRLEAMNDVRSMTPRDYREAWAWVHYLLDGPKSGRAALLGYLADLRTQPGTEPLSQRLEGSGSDPGAGMLAHLEAVREQPVAVLRDPVVRLQGASAGAESSPPRRRGFFSRLRDAMGL